MPKTHSFHDHIMNDVLGRFPGITSRAMFGGWGIYRDGVIFAIIADDALYFKVDDSNRKDFEKLKSRPFTYAKKDGEKAVMSYWLVSEKVMEDEEKLWELIEKSINISKKR